MNLLRITRWIGQSDYVSRYGVQTDYKVLFGYLSLSRHFRGCETWGIETRIFNRYRINFRNTGMPEFDKGPFSITLRLGGPIITLRAPIDREFRSVKVLLEKTITLESLLPASGPANA